MRQGFGGSLICAMLCKGGCYTQGLEEELDAEHIQRERGCLDCGSHRGIKLIDHVMKVLERLVEKKVKSKSILDSMQFGFTSGKGTMNAMYVGVTTAVRMTGEES